MKTRLTLLAITLCGALLLSGCNTMKQALQITQSIEGTGSATVETPAQLTTATVENARQEDGKFKADKLDIVHKGKLTGSRINLHFENYSRPLVKEDSE